MTEANLTLVAPLRRGPSAFPDAAVRTVLESDLADLGRLYFDSYPPGLVGADVHEATADIAACFRGDYGALEPDACLAATADTGLIGAILVVVDAPWGETPAGPFIIELMTDPKARRRGVGRGLVRASMSILAAQGHARVGLRVDESNLPARSLYDGLGFVPWNSD